MVGSELKASHGRGADIATAFFSEKAEAQANRVQGKMREVHLEPLCRRHPGPSSSRQLITGDPPGLAFAMTIGE